MATIMIVDDDPKVRVNLEMQIEEEGHQACVFEHGKDALAYLLDSDNARADLLLLDIRMPEPDGVTVIRRLAAKDALPPTIILSGEATISETVEALQFGVHDFIEKPFTRQRLSRSIHNCLRHNQLVRDVKNLQLHNQASVPLIGKSLAMTRLKEQIAKIAPTEGRVLLLGESGTGKELVAATLQSQSRRAKQPFVRINCAALPDNLIEDELFGHVRGAFTGATDHKAGLFEEAHRGTLFLDEIGDMATSMQVKLLRVLEDGRVRRLGGKTDHLVDVRIIAATHRDLKAMIAEGSFREDLYYRISSLPLTVPPLRERGEDVEALLHFYLMHFSQKNRLRLKRLDTEAQQALLAYPWPGNIRELKNVCERLVILGGDPIKPHDLPSELITANSPAASEFLPFAPLQQSLTLKDFQHQSEKAFIETILMKTGWNIPKAAKTLDIQRTYLYRKMNKLGIQRTEENNRSD